MSRVELDAPENAIGRNTVESIQCGLIFGTAGQVDRLVELFKRELGQYSIPLSSNYSQVPAQAPV